ncbi:MAG: 3-dehydroquinate synthase [Candidatus Dormibacteria bacterium]
MTGIRVTSAAGGYSLEVRAGLLAELPQRFTAAGRSVMVIADRNTATVAGSALAAAIGAPIHVFEPGEASKSFSEVERALAAMAGHGLDRDALLVAVGGGVVGDVAGVVAALYLRGVGLVHVPTTLLAQVDSAIGGKAAVNLPEGKNLVGAFKAPEAVYIDPGLLEGLPPREFSSGLAEIAKYSMISDAELFELLLSQSQAILQRDTELLSKIIHRCCSIKAEVVSRDERETGERAILNYGHTFGHALESAAGYGHMTHGEAISVGMEVAAELGEACGVTGAGARSRQGELLDGLGLPRVAPGMAPLAAVLARVARDKKSSGGIVRWVLPVRVGAATWGHEVPEGLVARVAGRVLAV